MNRLLDEPAQTALPGPEARLAGQFVTFTCAGQAFGIDIMVIREIRNWSPITPLPAQQANMLGVLDIRGRVVPVYDLAACLGYRKSLSENHHDQVFLVVSLADRDIGLLVDSVSDIIAIEPDDMRPVPDVEGTPARYLTGMAPFGDQLLAILDPHGIFALTPVEPALLD